MLLQPVLFITEPVFLFNSKITTAILNCVYEIIQYKKTNQQKVKPVILKKLISFNV
jgi:hypothetical protein